MPLFLQYVGLIIRVHQYLKVEYLPGDGCPLQGYRIEIRSNRAKTATADDRFTPKHSNQRIRLENAGNGMVSSLFGQSRIVDFARYMSNLAREDQNDDQNWPSTFHN